MMLSYLFLPHSTINGSPKCYCKQIINIFWHRQANKANNSEFLKISNPTKSHYPSWNRWKMLMEKSQCRSFFSQMLNFFCFTYCMSFIHVTNKFLPVRPIYMSVIQVTQPVGYVGTLPAIRINESTAQKVIILHEIDEKC